MDVKLSKHKSFSEFKTVNEESFSYGCVMFFFDPNEKMLQELMTNIDDSDLYTKEDDSSYGKETEPHVTALYGIHNDVPDADVKKIVEQFTTPVITVGDVSIFENEKFDVVKIEVNSDEMNTANKKLSALPFSSDYPDYKAHITLAYVKPGLGQKYVEEFESINLQPTHIVYSKADNTKLKFNFKDEN